MFWQLLLVLVLLIPLLAVILDSQVGKALAARLEAGAHVADPRVRQRLADLEGEVERLRGEVERLEEESRFLHDLLAERPPPDGGALEAGDPDD